MAQSLSPDPQIPLSFIGPRGSGSGHDVCKGGEGTRSSSGFSSSPAWPLSLPVCEVGFILHGPPVPREEVTTADTPYGTEDFGPDPSKQELIFDGIDRSVVDWNGHFSACVSGDPGAFLAAAHDIKLFAEVLAELLGEETVDDRV